MTAPKRLAIIILCGLLLLTSGCLELDIRIRINEDGSATITEKLAYSEALLDLASASPKDRALLDKSLTKEGALNRMAKMGKDTELVSHTVSDEVLSGTLFKQAVAVYKIPDINNLRISPPFPNLWREDNTCMTFVLEPCYERKPAKAAGGTDLPGYMAVEYRFASDKTDAKAKGGKQEAPPPLSPVQAQQIRDLLPVIQDMARSASVKVTLESYNTLCDGWWYLGGPHRLQDRDATHAVSYAELLNLSGLNRDEFDRPLLADEETLIDFIRGNWNGSHITKLLMQSPRHDDFRFLRDGKVPLIYPNVTANHGRRFIFLPSMIEYKRYFEGKTFDDKFAPVPPTH